MEYYFEKDSNLSEREEMGFDPPARVKQMGGVESDIKIFMEDYVIHICISMAEAEAEKRNWRRWLGGIMW